MDILFKNTTTYTEKELKVFQEFHLWKNTSTIIYAIIVVLALTYMIIVNITLKNWSWIILMFFILIMIFLYYKYIVITKKREINKKNENQTFTFYFYEEELKIQNKGKENIIKYSEIYRIYETKTNFYLYKNKEYSLIISKKGFEGQKCEDFRTFIKQRCTFKYKDKSNKNKIIKK